MNLCRKWSECKAHLLLLIPCHTDSLHCRVVKASAHRSFVDVGGRWVARKQIASITSTLSRTASWEELVQREESPSAAIISSELQKVYYTFREETSFLENSPVNLVLHFMGIYDKALNVQVKNLKIPHILLNFSQALKWNKQSGVYLYPGDNQHQ